MILDPQAADPLFAKGRCPENLHEFMSAVYAEWPFPGKISAVSAVQKSRNRSLVELQHEMNDQRFRLVAKQAESDRIVLGYRAIEALWARGFAAPAAFRVPRPLLLIPGSGISICERAPGGPMNALNRDVLSDDTAATVAAYVAHLHAAAVPADALTLGLFSSTVGTFRLLGELSRYANELSRRVLDAFQNELSQTNQLLPSHGDLSPKHIFLDAQSMTLIDWDKCSLAPPTFDIGVLIGRVATAGWTQKDGFSRTRRFCCRLLSATLGKRSDEFAYRVFAAFALLSDAAYVLRVTSGSDFARATAYIEGAERVLRTGHVDCF